ncbi:MAG: hypothetical protein JKY37_21235 [Nannocystaceae bacterium]|nr:hypothetical protein [Nannocystaceae bacterium]
MLRRSSLILALLVGGLGLAITTSVPEATANEGNYYWMFCRGTFDLDVGTTLKIHATKNASSAGSTGSKLAPGTCAWPARPLNKGERPDIKFDYSSSILSELKTSSATTALVQCSLSDNCVIRIKVRNEGDGSMEAAPHYGIQIRPHH